MGRILTVVGARPQFIKAGPVSRAIQASGRLSESLVHTGQHFDFEMSDIFFSQLGLEAPHHHLGIGGRTHGANTGRMIEAIERVLLAERPDVVMVYGDTDSTLAGALAAVKLKIPIAHVEAGLRSYDRHMPEEINRVLVDHVSEALLAPGDRAVKNLLREGLSSQRITCVGDVMLDTSLQMRGFETPPEGLASARDFVLATVHRADNTSAPRLAEVFDLLGHLGAHHPVILPLHPRTRHALAAQNITVAPGITITPPLGFLEICWLLARCKGVVTDSGGLQKEAYFFGKRSIVLREQTEWTELVDAGCNVLLPPGTEDALGTILDVLDDPVEPPEGLLGDGQTAVRIVRVLEGLV
jgi:UDP-GlcNAc3NAcA epimerase